VLTPVDGHSRLRPPAGAGGDGTSDGGKECVLGSLKSILWRLGAAGGSLL